MRRVLLALVGLIVLGVLLKVSPVWSAPFDWLYNVPTSKFKNFENHFFDDSRFSQIIRNTYGYDGIEIKTSMNAILADEIISDLLEIKIDDPVFKFVVRTQKKENEDLFAYKLSFFAGDKHQIEIIEKGDKLYGIHKD
ncbi:MAG: UTRA domain-containing protein [Erysipelotrichaceae bacterium]|nr:UTRA domain-containing protein [Erysipelotrichaceae bacterium]